jgi:ATP-dependent exoDNAse (exonuclease V) beta subunit
VRPSLLRAQSANDAITFDWAGELRRRIGTVIHAWLHRIAKEGVAHWNARRLNSERPTTVALLRSVGVAEEEMSGAVTEVERALAVTLESSRGRWCLQQHQGAECELALSGVVSGKFHHVRVDRTFVCDGVRWIIDYKSGTREGSGLEAFLDAELARYGPQIEIYSELVSQLDQRPVRAALYFPANGGWREWKPLTKAATQPEA